MSGNRTYRISAWFRTQGLVKQDVLRIAVYTNSAPMTSRTFATAREDVWEQLSLDVNLKEDVDVRLYIGTWTAEDGGCFWVDDVSIMNLSHRRGVVRRDGLSFTVKSAESGRVYEEGRTMSRYRA